MGAEVVTVILKFWEIEADCVDGLILSFLRTCTSMFFKRLFIKLQMDNFITFNSVFFEVKGT